MDPLGTGVTKIDVTSIVKLDVYCCRSIAPKSSINSIKLEAGQTFNVGDKITAVGGYYSLPCEVFLMRLYLDEKLVPIILIFKVIPDELLVAGICIISHP